MKSLHCLSLAAALAPALASAQSTAFIHRHGPTWSAAADFNNDSRRDAVLYDSVTGNLRIGLVDAAGNPQWTQRDSGIPAATGMAVTPATNAAFPAIFLTSPAFNQVRVIDPTGTPDVIFSPDGPEPLVLAPFRHAVPGNPGGVLVGRTSGSGGHSSLSAPAWGALWSLPAYAGIREGNPFSFTSSDGIRPAFLSNGAGVAATLRIQLASTAAQGSLVSLPGIQAQSRWTSRLYLPNATLITWVPDVSSSLVLYPTSEAAGVFSFGSPSSHSLGTVIRSIVPLETAASHEFAVSFADDSIRIYRFNAASPTTAPVLLQNLGTVGGPAAALLPTGPTSFLALRRSASGSESLQRLAWNGASYTPTNLPAPPPTASLPVTSNVLFFEHEPLVDPQPSEVHRQRVGDWSVSILPAGIARQVNFRTDSGPASGLSAAISSSIVNLPSPAVFTLPNQIDSASSFRLLSGATPGAIAPPLFSPPPGTQEAPPSGSSFSVRVSPGSSGTVWIEGPAGFSASPDGIVALSGPATIRAFVRDGSRQSPISSASYSFATPGPLAAPPIPDSNNDGVSDSWAALTGASNPADDSDNDGFLNFAEYNAGTDPMAPSSKPAPAPVPVLAVATSAASNAPVLTWSSSDPAVILQSSPDLLSWSVQTTGITTSGNTRSFTAPPPTPATPQRYWRLRR